MVDLLRKEVAKEVQIKKQMAVNNIVVADENGTKEVAKKVKERKLSVPKIKTSNLLNFSGELLQT
jgi:hypothetical protein